MSTVSFNKIVNAHKIRISTDPHDRWKSSMIHAAFPTDTTVSTEQTVEGLLCFARFWEINNSWMDNTCENDEHSRQLLWVGLVDQYTASLAHNSDFPYVICQM